MKSTPRKIALLFLAFLVLQSGCTSDPDLLRPDPEPSISDLKSAPADYYDTVDASSATALRVTLHAVIEDHNKIPYTSTATDTWNVLELADQDPGDANRILDVYLNASYPKYGEGNTDYNREHLWPKSYGFPNDGSSNYPYTDCHHLFLCNDSYNSSRSNKPFRYCLSGCTEKPTEINDGMGGGTGVYPGNSSWTSGSLTEGTWETWIGRRGDVARALFYMDVRYEGGTHGLTGHSEPDLILTDEEALIAASNTGSNISEAYMGMLSVLLEWHEQDPVDAREMARNDAVFSYQGNRNPFIDHPEWVDCLFIDVCGGGGDTTPPAAPTGLVATAGDGSVTLDWDDNGEGDLAGYTVYRGTSSGGPYSAVTGSLLTASGFTDTGLTNGTAYYYVVTATDDSANESGYGNQTGATPAGGGSGGDPAVWINEFHYDNAGGDKNEFVEIAGTAGLDLNGWSVVGYNGSGGSVYDTVALSGVLPDQSGGFGTLDFAMSGMQNGSPDGLALVDDSGSVVLFISYEGAFTAMDGPAAGMNPVDIGVAETSSTSKGHSLQLAGDGSAYADFSWQAPQSATPGAPNTGQLFSGGGPVNQAPTAEANGPYGADEGVAIAFSSAGSVDPDGSIVSWYWEFGDGATSTSANPSHAYTAAGNYTATLTVTDGQGATGSDTAPVTVNDVIPPAAPTGLGATAGDGLVDLDWANNGEADLAGYVLHRATTSGGPYTAITGPLTSSQYSDTSVTNGVTYFYVVTARDGDGNESGYGNEASATPAGGGSGSGNAWINEFHYDNDGTDTGEFFEIAGVAGTDLSGWSVVGYNGNGGTAYDTVNLGGTLSDQAGGYGALTFAMTGMQNGSPDGLALVDNTSALVMFISYEGVITAVDGPASGATSTDIGVSEPSTSPVGYSLQLGGDGTAYADFVWQGPATETPGGLNNLQTFNGSGGQTNQAPTAEANGPYSGDEGTVIAFSSAGSSDPDGSIVSWYWEFGDGATSNSPNPSHAYTAAGSYTATLTVTDGQGATGTDTADVTVTEVAVGQFMHVAAVLVDHTGGGNKRAFSQVTVVDTQGNPLAGVTVTGTFSGYVSGTYSGVTGPDGVTVITNPDNFHPKYNFTFCVDDLALSSWTYDGAANAQTCGTF